MDELRIYARDLAAEVRRVPSVLMVVVGLLLLALSASSEVVADARAAVGCEVRDVVTAMQTGSGGQDARRTLRVFAGGEDLESL